MRLCFEIVFVHKTMDNKVDSNAVFFDGMGHLTAKHKILILIGWTSLS